ncbi:hypothetical protein GDO78_007423, partial [Eleutherodactylus coqui]
FQVLKSASHYWPLGVVNGIHELPRENDDRTGSGNESDGTVIIHSSIVLPYHNESLVNSNASAYSNLSATVDIVEGTVNHGIVLNEQKGVTLLYFGSSKNSCISDPSICGPEGVSFSFFWKIQDQQQKKQQDTYNHNSQHLPSQNGGHKAQQTQAFGKKVTSHGFEIYSDEHDGYVKVYTDSNSKVWKASIKAPGPYWTHVLFTWTSSEGLKVYVNGTFNASDSSGQVSYSYGDSNDSLVLGTNNDLSKHYVNGAFDEFIIWERALNPQEIHHYFTAAIGDETFATETISSAPGTSRPMISTDAYDSVITNLTEDRGKSILFKPVLGYLEVVSQIVPNKSLTIDTAGNLTQANPDVGGLIDTVDTVMGNLAKNLMENPSTIVTLEGSSSVADYAMVKVPQKTSLSHYRFPSEGQSYISVPGEAFMSKSRTTIVGLLYHTMHRHYRQIKPSDTRYVYNHKADVLLHIKTASYLISLKVEPPPYLSPNLSGSPLITIQLTHILPHPAVNNSNHVHLYCAFLDFSSGSGIWSNEGCILVEGNLNFSVCRCNHLTNFAILMQVVPVALSNSHKVALSSISYIGCSLSIFCLAITLVTFAILSSVSTIRNQRYHIHANLSFAILVAQILLLISFHFVPGTSCWLSLEKGAIWAFVAPALFVIVVNIGILIAVTRIISRISADNYKVHRDANAFKLTAKAVAVLLPILGSSWIFGVLAVNEQSIIFQYMFAVFNSLQGFFIFLFHCLLNSEVRAAFKHKTKVWSLTSSSIRNINVKPFNSDVVISSPHKTSSSTLP